MSKDAKITPVEWEIMETIWELGKSPSVRNVLEHTYPNGEKAYTTVQTIMNNLEKKGFLKRKKIGLVNFYKPSKSRKQMVISETQQLLSRVFKGSVPALANFLINSESLNLEEIQTIKELLSEKEDKMKRSGS